MEAEYHPILSYRIDDIVKQSEKNNRFETRYRQEPMSAAGTASTEDAIGEAKLSELKEGHGASDKTIHIVGELLSESHEK